MSATELAQVLGERRPRRPPGKSLFLKMPVNAWAFLDSMAWGELSPKKPGDDPGRPRRETRIDGQEPGKRNRPRSGKTPAKNETPNFRKVPGVPGDRPVDRPVDRPSVEPDRRDGFRPGPGRLPGRCPSRRRDGSGRPLRPVTGPGRFPETFNIPTE